MAITLADFNKIWSSTSPLSPYTFSDDNYNEGWNFIGQIPPSRQMWDFLQKNNDEKMQYIVNNICVPTEIDETSASGDYYSYPVPTGKVFANFKTLGGKTIAWNQLVDTGITTVSTISGHKYYTLIDGTASIITSSGSAISVVDDSADMVCDLTLMFGSGSEPSTTADFTAIFGATHYPYNAGTLLSAGIKEVIAKDSSNNVVATMPIPSAVQSLEGYGWSAGTKKNYIDFVNKKYVQQVGGVDLGSLTWIYSSSGPDSVNNVPLFYAVYSEVSQTKQGICGKYVKLSDLSSGGIYPHDDKGCSFVPFYSSHQINVFDSSYSDASAFKTAMAGVMLYYELATPVETDISPILGATGIACGNTLTFDYNTSYRLPVPVSMDMLDGTNGLMTAQDKAKLDVAYQGINQEYPYLPLSGGTLTGDLSVGGTITGNLTGDVTGTASKAIADENGNNIASTYASIQYVDDKFAPIGTVVANSSSTEFSIPAYTAKVLNQITLSKGTWLVIGGNMFKGTTQGYVYGIKIDKVQEAFNYGNEGAVSQMSPANDYWISQESTIIVQINNSAEDVYLNGYSNHAVSGVTVGYLKAVRII